jgi:flavodoxin
MQMKKLTVLLSIALLAVLSFDVYQAASASSKTLIVYFTRANNVDREPEVDAVTRATFNVQSDGIYGNTELLAKYIHDAVDGDMFSIRVVDPYPYDVDETIAKIHREGDGRVKLSTHIDNIAQYETIFIGYPIFNATMPQPVFSFLEEYDFSGKTVVPFSTHRGSRMGRSVADLKTVLPNSKILEGYTVDGDNAHDSREEVVAWLRNIGFTK